MIAMACLLGCFSPTVSVNNIDINLHMPLVVTFVFIKLDFQSRRDFVGCLGCKPFPFKKKIYHFAMSSRSVFNQLPGTFPIVNL